MNSDEKTVTELGWSWNLRPDLEDLKEALAPFGLHVYEDPQWDGTSYTNYLIASEPLSAEELEARKEEEE